jgi:two-component system, chemotaxis family, CheB/CheR fusion protein
VRDLTDRKTIDDARQLQLSQERAVMAQAEAANRLKDDFLAVLSHELKHPLNLIHVKAEMLPRIPEARGVPAIQAVAESIQRAVIGQAKIIDDLLDLSRVRTGKLALNLAMTDIATVLGAIADAIETDAASRGITFSSEGLEKPVWAKVDPVRFDQIIWNLLSNALKFTPAGGAVSIRLGHAGPDLRVDVTDTGQGIEARSLPHIFDMFSQGSDTRRKAGAGMGIGLALVKQLVEMHGGRVSAQSEGAGKGCAMTVWLPSADHRGAASPVLPGKAQSLSGLHLLVVDDDSETAAAFASLLGLEGATVATARSGEEALAFLERARVDLLICDVSMPDMDGFEFLSAVRARPQLSQLPAIAVTGYAGAADDPRARDAGFDLYLTKPVSLGAVIAAAEQVFFWRGMRDGASES